MTTSEEIKTYACGLGFDLVGVATADPLAEHGDRLRRWLAAGMHGEMDYMERHAPQAVDPAHGVPGARAVVVVGLAYRWNAADPADGALRGRTSAYAWGTDYHQVMEDRLEQLAGFLVNHGARVARYYVDTGPTLDRAIAHRAGLGWWGKNTMLITKTGHGSYVFLGEVFTDLASLSLNAHLHPVYTAAVCRRGNAAGRRAARAAGRNTGGGGRTCSCPAEQGGAFPRA